MASILIVLPYMTVLRVGQAYSSKSQVLWLLLGSSELMLGCSNESAGAAAAG